MHWRAIALVTLPLAMLAGCARMPGLETRSADEPAATTQATTTTTTTTKVSATPLAGLSAPTKVQSAELDITGWSAAGARVHVSNGTGVEWDFTADPSGRFVAHVTSPAVGSAWTYVVTVSTPVTSENKGQVKVTREMSEAEYKDSAGKIDYDQLVKGSSLGTVVTSKAKVMQYDSRTGTASMLVEVTKGSYDIWKDLVLLEVDAGSAGEIDQKDIIQFWGTVTTPTSYSTAIGGSNTVPTVTAKYLSLIKKD